MTHVIPPSKVQRRIETDHAGRVLYATPEAAWLLNTTARDMTGRTIGTLFPLAQRLIRQQLRKVVAGHAAAPVEVPVQCGKEGQPVTLSVSVGPLDARRLQWRLILAGES